ncbi:MAG: S8 family serine peptidase [Thermoplasmata archaeon]|nr:MAG: S8 family serine peptidase [Thermoplasmata archaeon]
MRKKMAIGMVLTLIVVAFVGIPINVGAEENEAVTPQLTRSPFNGPGCGMSLLTTLQSSSSNSLMEIVPSWVDIVDAEVVSNDGEGVYIAVIDTGLIEAWPYFFSEANIAWELGKGFSYDITWDPTIEDPVYGELLDQRVLGPLRDDRGFVTNEYGYGHGTFTTSLITGYRLGDFWVRGVAPKATIIPVLIYDTWLVDCPDPTYPGCYGGKIKHQGFTYESMAAGINYIADLAEILDGKVIISLSMGWFWPSEILEDAVNNAIDKGVIFIACAGNEGYTGMRWPAAYPQVISVGAAGWTENWVPGFNPDYWLNDVPEKLNTKDVWGNNWQIYLTEYSSRPNKDLGQKPNDLDLTTIASWVFTPWQMDVYWDGIEWITSEPTYGFGGGTSAATPIVASIAALVLQDHPELNQPEMEKILKNAARGLPLACNGAWLFEFHWFEGAFRYGYFEWQGTDYGAGFLQADAALKAAKTHA